MSKITPLVFEGDYAPMKMIEFAVKEARPRGIGQSPRWVAVREVFGYGSTTSAQLCTYFGLDPYEMLDGDQDDEEDEGCSPSRNQGEGD
jgi:hypothetical protein